METIKIPEVAKTFAMKNAYIQKRFQESPKVIENIITRAGTGAEKRHRVLALSQPARIRVTARFSIYH